MRFTFGGGAEARTPVHNILSDKDYTFRSRFVIPSKIFGFNLTKNKVDLFFTIVNQQPMDDSIYGSIVFHHKDFCC